MATEYKYFLRVRVEYNKDFIHPSHHLLSTVFPLPARKTRKRAGVDSMKFDELPEKRKHILFAAGFILLLIAATDIWNWNDDSLMWGLPVWVIWHIVIVILTGIYYILFCSYIWRD